MRNNVLLTFMFAVLVVSVIMLGFYFYKFNSGFSANNEDWGGFGSYFASITGLLAFAGVLYTAWQSEQRANKADLKAKETEEKFKEESIRREERDLFFKLLDLYQRQVDLGFSKDGISGVEVFKEYGIKANTYLKWYIALNGLKNKKHNPEEIFYTTMKDEWEQVPENEIYKKFEHFIASILKEHHLGRYANHYGMLSNFPDTLMKSMSIEDKFQAMRYVADLIYEEYGHLLGQYYRTIFYLLHLTSGFKEKTEYYKIFRSQLSRYELLLLLYNVVSSQSTKEVKSLYKECDLFNNIIADDVLGYVNWNKKEEHTVSDFIDQLLNS
jgi:hypothetical protein